MACHTPPLKKAKKQREMPLPSLSSFPFKNVEFRDGVGLRLGYGISPCFLFLRFFERWNITDRPKISSISWRKLCYFLTLFAFFEHLECLRVTLYKLVMVGAMST